MKKDLTEKQQAFIEALFGEAKGDPYKAKDLAGYSKNTLLSEVMDNLADEIRNRVDNFISIQAIKAAFAIDHVLNDPTDLGNKERLAASKDILDRAGYKAKDKVEVSGEAFPAFIIPKKEKEEDDDEGDSYSSNS